MTRKRPPIAIRQSSVIVGLSGLALIAVDQATKRWAKSALSPGESVPLVQSWLRFKRTIRAPLEIAGSPLLLYVLISLLIVGLLALVAARGVGRPIHGVAVGLILGALASSLFDFVHTGIVDNIIEIRPASDRVLTVSLAFIAFVLGGVVLAIGALAGSFPGTSQQPGSVWPLRMLRILRRKQG